MTAWDDEVAPTNLVAFRNGLSTALGLTTAIHTGIKGDAGHTGGYHRSRRWILEEGDPDDYSIQDPRDLDGNQNWLAAVDLTLSAQFMILLSTRLYRASTGGTLPPQVHAWYGTVNGVTVTGWDVVDDGPSTSDASHLRHIHLDFFRGLADADHTAVTALLLGTAHTSAQTVTASLTPGVAATVALTTATSAVTVVNQSAAGLLWVRLDGGTAAVAGADTTAVPAGAERTLNLGRATTPVVSVVADHVADYTIAGRT